MDVEEIRIHAGLRWRLATCGPPTGAIVLLMHGFPESRWSWRNQFQALAQAGYRACAPDLPGYSGSEPPASYDIAYVGDLIAELARVLSPEPVHLVGHDWGGILAQAAAYRHPGTFRSITAACSPHPAVFASALRDPRQMMHSWYVAALQVPGIERALGAREAKPFKRLAPFASEDFTGPAEIARAIAYYRVNLNPLRLGRHRVGRIAQPGLVIHAGRDRYVGYRLMARTAEMFDQLRRFEVIACGHFLQSRCADRFNRVLVRFLRGVDGAARAG